METPPRIFKKKYSECISLWLKSKSQKKVPNHDPEHCPPKEKMLRDVIWHLFVRFVPNRKKI